MSIRNNQQRVGGSRPDSDAAATSTQAANPLQFVTPTEFVELPSQGKGYPPEHPLHNQEVIEIRFMTAKDEDILTSQALLKKGLALERMMENVIIDKKVKPSSLLVGDRNAILIATRASGYGNHYETSVACPACGERSTLMFNLEDKSFNHGGVPEDMEVEATDNGTFVVAMPLSKLKVEVRMLNGKDEQWLLQTAKSKKKHKLQDSALTNQYRRMIVSVNGQTDRKALDYVIENLPAIDSRHLRLAYKSLSPDVKVFKDFSCPACNHEQALEVPFNTDFFWPDR